jgi:hypothetical protein
VADLVRALSRLSQAEGQEGEGGMRAVDHQKLPPGPHGRLDGKEGGGGKQPDAGRLIFIFEFSSLEIQI